MSKADQRIYDEAMEAIKGEIHSDDMDKVNQQMIIRQANKIRELTKELERVQIDLLAATDAHQELLDEHRGVIHEMQTKVNELPSCLWCGMTPPIHSMSCNLVRFGHGRSA